MTFLVRGMILSALFLCGCNQEVPVAEIKSNLDRDKAECRSKFTKQRDRANCLNGVEDRDLIPYLHGNALLLQRAVEKKRLELAIAVDNGEIAQDVAAAELKEFYAQGAVQRDAANAELNRQEAAASSQKAAAAAMILQNRPAPYMLPQPVVQQSPIVNTTCTTSVGIMNCQSR